MTSDAPIKLIKYDLKVFKDNLIPIEYFDCGVVDINKFLKRGYSYDYTTQLVFINNELVAFISYRCSSIAFNAELQDNSILCQNLEPAIEIGYFAVDKKYQGNNMMLDFQGQKIKLSRFVFQFFQFYLSNLAQDKICAKSLIGFSLNKPKNLDFVHKMGFQDVPQEDTKRLLKSKWNDNCVPVFMPIIEKDVLALFPFDLSNLSSINTK